MIPLQVILTILGLLGAWYFGYRQGKTSQKALDLNVTRATPKIGTIVKIDKRQDRSPGFPPDFYLIATIYNEGELAARKLNGKCRLFSPINEISERDIPIYRDFLGSTPYELEAIKIVGTTVYGALVGNTTISMSVEFDFEYFGLADEEPERYCAKYQYDQNSRQFVRPN